MNSARLTSTLAVALSALITTVPPVRAEAPPLEAELSIDTRWVILSSHTRSFLVEYRVRTPLTQEEFAGRFPEVSGTGLRGDCGIRSIEGVHITLDEPMDWKWASIWRDVPGELPPSPTVALTPPALETLVYDPEGPGTLDHMIYRDLTMATRYEREWMRSMRFEIEADEFYGDPVAWTATITFEAYCRYFDPQTGNLVAILTSADLGGEPVTLTQSDEDIPRYGVPIASESWSVIKSLYRQ